eukprot:superscaffoldBa00004474_g18940
MLTKQQYHSKIDVLIDEAFKEMVSSLVSKFAAVLDGVLSKLSRYDEGTFFSSILSFTCRFVGGGDRSSGVQVSSGLMRGSGVAEIVGRGETRAGRGDNVYDAGVKVSR